MVFSFPPLKGCRKSFKLLISAAFLIAILSGLASWRINSLENAVWEKDDLLQLEKHELVLMLVSALKFVVPSLSERADGLRGDLAFHRKEYNQALNCYDSIIPMWIKTSLDGNDPNVVAEIVKSRGVAHRDFHLAFSDMESVPLVSLVLRDEWFDTRDKDPWLSQDLNAWPILEAVAQNPLPHEDVQSLRRWLKMISSGTAERDIEQAVPAMRILCGRHVMMINRLKSLPTSSIFPDDGAAGLSVVSACRDYADLLFIDAVTLIRSGEREASQRSLDATYLLLQHMQRAHGFTPTLICNILRQDLIEAFEGSFASRLQPLFRHEYLMNSNSFELALKSEYQNTKWLLEQSLTGSSATQKRMHQLVMQKHLANFNAIRESPGEPPSVELEKILAHWAFRYRKYLAVENQNSFNDGQKVAEAFAEISSSIVAATAMPNLTKVDAQLKRTIKAEQRILAEKMASLGGATNR